MVDDEPLSGRRRPRGPEATERSKALERLKARIHGSDATGPQIRLENPVYDTVPEDEYNVLVAKRREQARSFIVDDEGLGYGDEGEEEDWSQVGFNISSGESEGESERPKRKKVEKKNPQPKRPSSSLSAAAAMMGGQRLSSMFTSSVFKKSRDDRASESIVDDVIVEFAADETDRLRRKRAHVNSSSSSVTNDALRINNMVRDNPSADCIGASSRPANGNAESVKVVNSDDFDSGFEQKSEAVSEIEDLACGSSENGQAPVVESDDRKINEGIVEEKKIKKTEIYVKSGGKKEVFTLNAKVKEKEEEDPALSATAGWKEVMSGAGGVDADSKDALQNQ